LLDGGLGTTLEALDADVSGPLWSARAVREAPATVRRAHEAFFEAGADVATAATYQTTDPGLIRAAVTLGRDARAGRAGLVAGSVGPYGAVRNDRSEYTGAYPMPKGGWKGFHAPRLDALREAGVDLLVIETFPRFDELRAVADLMTGTEMPALFSVTLRDAFHLPDGTLLATVARFLDAHPAVDALGINCVPATLVLPALATLRRHTAKPLAAYPKTAPPEALAWLEAGARIVGGCCGTTPSHIRAIRRLLDASPHVSAAS